MIYSNQIQTPVIYGPYKTLQADDMSGMYHYFIYISINLDYIIIQMNTQHYGCT